MSGRGLHLHLRPDPPAARGRHAAQRRPLAGHGVLPGEPAQAGRGAHKNRGQAGRDWCKCI